MNIKTLALGLLVLAIIAVGCKKKDDPVIPNEEELITTLTLTLVSQTNSDTVVFRFQDLDGEGGNAPIVIGGTLEANHTYNGSVQILNEQETPAEDITEEVLAEAEEHQFFYATEGSLDLTSAYADADMNGNPIGLSFVINTLNTSTGKLVVTLRHEPDKNASGVSNGDITNAGGETDIEVRFDVDIQ